MLCFDSDFLVDYLDGVPATREFLDDHETEAFYVPTVVLFEIYRGELDPDRVGLSTLRTALDWADPLPFTERAAGEAATIEVDLKRRGEDIGARDTMIAGVVRDAGGTVVTRNTRHFDRVPDLDVTSY